MAYVLYWHLWIAFFVMAIVVFIQVKKIRQSPQGISTGKEKVVS
jgi:hypothetical protein